MDELKDLVQGFGELTMLELVIDVVVTGISFLLDYGGAKKYRNYLTEREKLMNNKMQ